MHTIQTCRSTIYLSPVVHAMKPQISLTHRACSREERTPCIPWNHLAMQPPPTNLEPGQPSEPRFKLFAYPLPPTPSLRMEGNCESMLRLNPDSNLRKSARPQSHSRLQQNSRPSPNLGCPPRVDAKMADEPGCTTYPPLPLWGEAVKACSTVI